MTTIDQRAGTPALVVTTAGPMPIVVPARGGAPAPSAS
ncbi:hypothetical protein HDA37_004388 [Pseudonocardia antarctica]|uniref:Uncharacterized protein n=1 Tax=Pseudonocardia alni TaxID=33907 RepID=A0A852W558_PSEA5|nr:hypothetical protein [Pseudonocardia antarctica]